MHGVGGSLVMASAGGGLVIMPVLLAVSVAHLINDTLQSVLLSIYPMVREPLGLDYVQIGLITLVFQLTASVLQPFVGLYTDRRPLPFSLPSGMVVTGAGILLLAFAENFWTLLLAATLIGVGSSVFHPEASRVARLASGGRYGFAQSLFQVGGNSGQALAPLLVALFVYPLGQAHAAWFALVAGLGVFLLLRVSRWYRDHLEALPRGTRNQPLPSPVDRPKVIAALAILLALTFSKNVYMAAFSSYYTFFLIERFGVSVQAAQLHLFVFLGAVAAGTMLGGPLGDRIGRKPVLWLSIAGVLPFSLALPFLSLPLTVLAAIVVGVLMASAFPAIVVYAQELMPGRVGMVAGLFFGFAFGMGGIGAVLVGWLADVQGLTFAFRLCALLPAIGLLVTFLPDLDALTRRGSRQIVATG
ncbi:MAG: MFS transporter [Geminicoccaceae bacterium]|nr:MAG: MFS transporter [Geminicoccaceae bacterium]